MSVQALTWVLENSQARLGARLVLIAIANESNRVGANCWASVETLAEQAHLSERQTRTALRELESLGEIADDGRSRAGTHTYRIVGMTHQGRILPPEISDPNRSDSAPDPKSSEALVSGSSSEVLTVASPPAPRFPRSRDLVFEALEDVFGKAPLGRLRGSWNVATKELKDSGVEPAEIRDLVEFARGDRSSEWRVSTPMKLAANVGMLRRMLADRPRRPYDPDPDWSAILEQERETTR